MVPGTSRRSLPSGVIEYKSQGPCGDEGAAFGSARWATSSSASSRSSAVHAMTETPWLTSTTVTSSGWATDWARKENVADLETTPSDSTTKPDMYPSLRESGPQSGIGMS